MAWQVRHKSVGLFMGVSHGKGHYSNVSECCKSLGVYCFRSSSEIESLFEAADSPHLPDGSRLKREDFIVEDWSIKDHDYLLDSGLLENCALRRVLVLESFGPVGLN